MSGVVVQQRGSTLLVTLDRPETLNALTLDDIAALHSAMDLAPDVRAVVFAGVGERAFSTGMNVDEFLSFDVDGARAFIAQLRDLLRRVRTAPVATICAVDGYCLGAAFELALACDLRVVTTRAVFGLPEIKVGIPSVVDAALLQQYVGLSLAKEMILTGENFPVQRLTESGLCNEIVMPAGLDPAVHTMLDRVTGHTPTVVAAQKRLFEVWQNTTLTDGADRSVEEFARVFAAAETRAHLAHYRAALGGGR
ncbi:enoyl-CoA hydratase/isomerase family protein [Pseudonocardia bannensis]|uniref:Enoyl-CoA hydratase n=1 Tax=Pseudonocardia bannensis TaxID=630973 RepID=A0A848DP70_9PSEU|nr:enoyl-CoA hydratase-related protein [Pseudonocardia bannensis]NMH94325.1 enoyl-CoA hydratase [Pseudonocardia bannensis]